MSDGQERAPRGRVNGEWEAMATDGLVPDLSSANADTSPAITSFDALLTLTQRLWTPIITAQLKQASIFFDRMPKGAPVPREPDMTVGDLIAKLQEFDSNLPVVSPFGEFHDPSAIDWVGLGEDYDWSQKREPGQPSPKRQVVWLSESDESWRWRD